MPFHATVVQVLIASPGDTQAERTAILSQASRWNGRHGRGRAFVLSPWLYELHSTPILGDRPQAIINSQGVDKSDVVVAVFAARIGSATGVDISGTVEEINRAREKGIPVHVYFSDAGLPRDVDAEQLGKLREFQKSLETQGLYASYGDEQDLARQVIDALEFDLDAFEAVPAPEAPSGVDLRVTHEHKKEQSGMDKNNKVKYRHTVRDLVVTNSGTVTAEDLQLLIESSSDSALHIETVTTDGWTEARDLPGRSSFGFRCFPKARRVNADVTARWLEGGEERSQKFSVMVS